MGRTCSVSHKAVYCLNVNNRESITDNLMELFVSGSVRISACCQSFFLLFLVQLPVVISNWQDGWNLSFEQRKWILKCFWKCEKMKGVQRRWRAEFDTAPPSRVTITKLSEKFEREGIAWDLKKERCGRKKSVSERDGSNGTNFFKIPQEIHTASDARVRCNHFCCSKETFPAILSIKLLKKVLHQTRSQIYFTKNNVTLPPYKDRQLLTWKCNTNIARIFIFIITVDEIN